MLEMKRKCERCGAPLEPSEKDAWICSFECTFCSACSEHVLGGICPNCEGELVRRPTRQREAPSLCPVEPAG